MTQKRPLVRFADFDQVGSGARRNNESCSKCGARCPIEIECGGCRAMARSSATRAVAGHQRDKAERAEHAVNARVATAEVLTVGN